MNIWQIVATAGYKRTIGILAVLIIVAAVPLTVFIAQKQQEIRQRASELPATPPFPSTTTQPLPAPQNLKATCASNGTTVNYTWDAVSGATGYTVRINKEPFNDWMGPGDEVPTVTSNSLDKTITPNTQYDWAVQSAPWSDPTVGRASGGTFSCSPNPTNAPTPTCTPRPPCLDSNPPCTVVPPSEGTFCAPSPTPNLTNTPIPTTTQPPSVNADVNRDGCISMSDFNEWLYAFQNNGTARNPNFKPDTNSDGSVNLLDYNVWFDAMRSRKNLCG